MRIGIVAQSYEGGQVVGTKTDYLNFIQEFGTPVVIYPNRNLNIDSYQLDGLVLPGGSDVNPARYSPWPKWWTDRFCYTPDSFLEYFDVAILPTLIARKLPIFGICRGLQTLNVHFGGSLHMNLPRHPHSMHKQDLVHGIHIVPGGRYVRINSFHHQAIAKLAPGLEIVATSDDGIIEAIRHQTLPIYAVQWHPERLPEDNWSRTIMNQLFV